MFDDDDCIVWWFFVRCFTGDWWVGEELEESQRFCLEPALQEKRHWWRWDRGAATCWLMRVEGRRSGLGEGRRRGLQGL